MPSSRHSSKVAPESVVAQPGHIRHPRALAGCGDGGIRGIAAEALQPAPLVAGELRELVHRLTQADQVEHL
jgi:hypothetical protein